MPASKDDNLFMAKICEQTERFDDMVSYMKAVVNESADLSIEERNLLSVAYKNAIGAHRTAWRALSSIEAKEESKGSKQLPLLKEYKLKIEAELNKFCNDILALLDAKLIPGAEGSNESSVFYLKMKGDYHRYIAEYSTGDAHQNAQDGALQAYNKATEVATAHLKTTHPIRLGLALNSSVFYYEVMNDPTKACHLAKQAFDEAIADIEQLDDDVYKDATTIMQLIRDNLTLWTSELDQENEGDS